MLRKALTIVTLVTVSAITLETQANDWDEFWARYRVDVARNEAWPQPFLPKEQMSVRMPFAMMVNQGWQEQNTLTEYHFDAEEQVLNLAGIHKIQSILRSAPAARQTVFVHAGFDREVNEQRLAHVRNQIAEWVPAEFTPAIVMTTHRPYALPGGQADFINRQFEANLPTPVLPSSSAGGAASSSGN